MIVITGAQLKELLNVEKAKLILESIGCHSITENGNKICASNPNGDKKNAICCYSGSWNVEDYTRGEYQAKKCRDIISFVEFICDISFPQAMKKICSIIGENYYYNKVDTTPLFIKFLDFVETGKKQEDEGKINVLPERILGQFEIIPNKKWLDEGISIEAQKYFQLGIDIDSGRIIIPIRTELGDLCGIKGRLLRDEEANGDKYLYIYSCPKSRILYGLWQNLKMIKEKHLIIIVESEKSVIKLYSLGYPAVAIGGKVISDIQAELILRCDVDIILAFDEDVTDSELEENVQKLIYPVKTQKIEVIKDELHLMKTKESPCDNVNTWETLYESCRKEVE